jgi:hypothetical protein
MSLTPASAGTAAAPADSWAVMRTRIALALVLLYALASGAAWLKLAASTTGRSAPDEISTYERRFQEVRAALPARGVVGYLGRTDPAGRTPAERGASSLLDFKHYLLAQYALAPVVLIESTEPDFVVGNFEPGRAPSTPAGFRIDRDFGNGLVLFRRSP